MLLNAVPDAYASQPADSPSSLSTQLKMLSRRWRIFVASIGICLAIALIVTAVIPRTYEAVVYCTVNTDANRVTNLDASDPLADILDMDEPPSQESHARLLQGDALKSAFAAQLGVPVTDIPKITVTNIVDTNLISVAADAHTPQAAANDANEYVQLYFQQLIANRNQDLQSALNNIEQQADLARTALSQVEDRQRDFEQKYGIDDLASSRDSQLQNITGVKTQQEQTEAALSAAVARVASLKSQLANMPQYVSTVPNPEADASVQALQKEIADLQAEDAGLAKQYSPTYYRRSPIIAQIASLQSELAQLRSSATIRNLKPSDEYDELHTQLEEAQADRQALYAQDDGLQREVAEQDGQMDHLTYLLAQDAELGREIDQLSANYRLLTQKRDGLKLRIADPSLNIRVQDAAMPPIEPIKPNLVENVVLGLILGLLAAWYLASVQESKDDRIYSVDEAAGIIGAPVIASVPLLMDTEHNAPHEIMPLAPATEFYRRLAATLTFAANGAGNASPALVIGSAGRGEGRSLMVSNLAAVAGMDGRRVLVVDADTRNPVQHKRFNTPSEPGLTDYLLGREKLANVIHPTACKNVQVVPCGMTVPNPIQLLYSNRMAKFIDATRDLADLILYDVPSCDGVIDPAIVASQVDGVLMVTGHESATRSKYIDAVDLMADAQARIIGVVSTDQSAHKATRRRETLDLSANIPGGRDMLGTSPLQLTAEPPEPAQLTGKWRRPTDLNTPATPVPAAPPQPAPAAKESNFVFAPGGESNGAAGGHKTPTNGSVGSGPATTPGAE